MNLLELLQMSPWSRHTLVNKKATYRVRWSDEPRGGTITRVTASTIWMGCFCYHHDDLVDAREVE